ncbi:MAG: hypothetical protein ONB05_08885, partial [candidate division KSB1 bacterium]|nr:hypothetical protein [candidate division KSB1 bacterium]
MSKMENLISSAKTMIPTVDSILDEAWEKLGLNKKVVNNKFGQVLVAMDVETTKIFRDYEKQALLELAKEWLRSQKEDVRR